LTQLIIAIALKLADCEDRRRQDASYLWTNAAAWNAKATN
jgi:hypothetical protein